MAVTSSALTHRCVSFAVGVDRRYCVGVLTPALHNVMETSCSEDSEFSLKGLVKGFNAYKAVSFVWFRPASTATVLLRPPFASLACALMPAARAPMPSCSWYC